MPKGIYKRTEEIKRKTYTLEWKQNVKKATKEAMKDPNLRERMSKTIKESMNKLEIRQRISKATKEGMNKPGVKERISKGVKKSRAKIKRTCLERYGVDSYSKTEQFRNYMINGGSSHSNSFITDHSKEELKLVNLVELICRDLNLSHDSQHKPLKNKNYRLDDCIPKYKIAIEWDGWFHFCDQEHKDYHKWRQEEIEREGWRFIRYNIFQKFPTEDQVKEDIEKLLF